MSDKFYYLKDKLTGHIYRQPNTKSNDWPDGMPVITTKAYADFLVYCLNSKSVEAVVWPPEDAAKRIPYLSQWGEGADVRSGDCGPAALGMIVHAFTEVRPTVNQVADRCGQPTAGEGAKYTGHDQLRKGAAYFGITLETRSPYTERGGLPRLSLNLIKSQLDDGKPSIALIHYGVLRDYTNGTEYIKNQDQKFDRGHWCVPVDYKDGMLYFNDSDFWGDRVLDGDYRVVPEAIFERALKAIAPGCSVGEQGLVMK